MKSVGIYKKFNKRKSAALEYIYNEYYRILVIYAIEYLGERMAAEDCVQEAIIATWESDIKFVTDLTLRSYLYTAVRNRALKIIRHEKVKDEYSKEKGEVLQTDDEQALITQEYYQLLFSSIERLKPEQREIIELNLLEGGKLVDIAEGLNISYRTAKRRKESGINELKKAIGDALFVAFLVFLANPQG